MNYAILSYKVFRNNGSIDAGETPYRGDSIKQDVLADFIKGFYAGPPNSYVGLEVEVKEMYDSEQQWITDVHMTPQFKYLQEVTNYAGDLIDEYKLPRQDGR